NPVPTSGTLGPNDPINHVEILLDLFDVQTLDLDIPVGDGCPPSEESITLIAGGLEYDDFCLRDADTVALQDVYDEFESLFGGKQVTWYDVDTGGNTLPNSTIIDAGTTYYADFGDPSCTTRIPV